MSLKKIKIKYLIWLIIIVLGAYGIYAVFFPTPEQPNYITAKVMRGNVERTVLADGSISAFKQVSVGAQVSGQIKKMYVELGQQVSLGDLIAEIDDLPQQNDLKQAQADLERLYAQRQSSAANLRNAQLNYDRQVKLVQQKAGAQFDLDNALAQLDVYKADISAIDAQIVRAEIAVDTAKLNLGYTKITSPMDGVIVAKPVDEGQTVNSAQTAPTIVKVAQLDKMTVEAQISEADVINVKAGMPVYFTILGLPNKRFDGVTLRTIEPAPTSINNEGSAATSSASAAIYYNGLFEVDNPDNILRISMTAQVYIVLASAPDVLYIPSMSVNGLHGDNQAFVYVLNQQGELVQKEITLGIDNNVNIEVKSGLEEGETIVMNHIDGSSVGNNNRAARIRF